MKAIREAEWSGLAVPGRQGVAPSHVRQGALTMRLVFAGTPEAALPSLRGRPRPAGTRSSRCSPDPDAPAGGAAPSPHRRWPRGLPKRAAWRCFAPSVRATRRSCNGWPRSRPDCCPVVAYGALLPQPALDIPPHGWVNLHFSLLPAWRGAAPVQHALIAGDEVTGATTFRLVRRSTPVRRTGSSPRRSSPTTPLAPCSTGSPTTARACSSPPWTASRTAPSRNASSRRRASRWRPKLTAMDGRVDWTAHGIRDRPAGARGCTPGARRLDLARGPPAQAAGR